MDNKRIVKINNTISERELSIVQRVLNKYDILPDKVEKQRSVYKIISGEKVYCLKKMSHDSKKALKGNLLVNYLKEHGFNGVANYINSKDGKTCIKLDKKIYYLTDWIAGRECNIGNYDELKAAARLLADFHVKSKGFASNSVKIASNNKNWPEIFEQRKNDILEFIAVINKKRIRSTFDEEYKNTSERFIRIIDMSKELLNNSHYMQVSMQSHKNKTLCHDSFYYQNILIDDMGKMYIIDLDSTLYDIWVYDLAKFIRRILFKGVYGWNFQIAKELIDEYNSINPLSDEEMEILLAFLIFPHKFWKLGKKRYTRKKEWSEDKFISRLNKLNKYLEKQEIFLNKFLEEYNIKKE